MAVSADLTPRVMEPADLDWAAGVWHQGWHDGHAGLVPEALTAMRGLQQFRDRLERYGTNVRVAGPLGAPLGLCVIHRDHLDQLFVARHARGLGLAQTLLADGEARLAATGHTTGYLDCAPQNHRARAFYEKCGWQDTGIVPVLVETERGPFELQCTVFRKELAARA